MCYLLTDYKNRTLIIAFISCIWNPLSNMWGEDEHETCTDLDLAEAVTPLPYSVLGNFMLLNYGTSKSKF